MDLQTLLTFIAASTILSLAPGPDNIFVLIQSALYGPRAGIFITLGLCTGLIVHTTAVAMGIAAIFLVSKTAFTVLKSVGALYLLYLAWLAFRAQASQLEVHENQPVKTHALYRRGIIMNLSNPKVAIFFLAFLPQFADPNTGQMSFQLFKLGLIFIAVALTVFSSIAWLAGFLTRKMQQSPKIQEVMNKCAAAIFVALAVKLATSSNQA